MGAGWIKIHRDILEWEWADDSNLFTFFIKLIILVNHQDKKWKGGVIKKGTILTSYLKLGTQTGFSESSVKRHLKKLIETGEVEVNAKQGLHTEIKIVKYTDYQYRKQ